MGPPSCHPACHGDRAPRLHVPTEDKVPCDTQRWRLRTCFENRHSAWPRSSRLADPVGIPSGISASPARNPDRLCVPECLCWAALLSVGVRCARTLGLRLWLDDLAAYRIQVYFHGATKLPLRSGPQALRSSLEH